MKDLKCECGKILCQITDKQIIIKCRHCKRYITIETEGLKSIEYKGESRTVEVKEIRALS